MIRAGLFYYNDGELWKSNYYNDGLWKGRAIITMRASYASTFSYAYSEGYYIILFFVVASFRIKKVVVKL